MKKMGKESAKIQIWGGITTDSIHDFFCIFNGFLEISPRKAKDFNFWPRFAYNEI